MKRALVLLLVLVMALGLCACGASEEDVVGAWERETFYLDSYGCDATMYLFIADTGDCASMLVDANTGEFLNGEIGEWTLDGNEVVAVYEGDNGAETHYKYVGGKLKNGDYKFEQTIEAEEIFDELLG